MAKLLYTHDENDLVQITEMIANKLVQKLGLNNKGPVITKGELINNEKCAELLGVSVGTLISWRKKGKIPYRQYGRSPLYCPEEVLHAFHDQKEQEDRESAA